MYVELLINYTASQELPQELRQCRYQTRKGHAQAVCLILRTTKWFLQHELSHRLWSFP